MTNVTKQGHINPKAMHISRLEFVDYEMKSLKPQIILHQANFI